MSDETTALIASIRELADGEDPADVEALVGRIENLHPAKRILLALRGHRIGRDERVVALLDAIDSVAARTFASWSLEDVLLDLDEWSAFQAESFGLDGDLFDSPSASRSSATAAYGAAGGIQPRT
ncbi:MAG: hypothetical protein JNL79_24990 [Myxococcales bacterium]|nr:hypothetical protein [Myxococcales bacterium]